MAEKTARELVKSGRESTLLFNLLGVVLCQKGKLEEAVSIFKRSIIFDPSSADSYCNLAKTLSDLGRIDEAFSTCEKSINLNRDSPRRITHLSCSRKIRRTQDALVSYNKAIELNPGFLEAHANRGSCLVELDQLTDALAVYNRLIELKPDVAKYIIFREAKFS